MDIKKIFLAHRLGRQLYEHALIVGYTREDDYALSNRLEQLEAILAEIRKEFPETTPDETVA